MSDPAINLTVESIRKVTIEPDDVVIIKVKNPGTTEEVAEFIALIKERLGTDRVLAISGADIEVWKP